MNDTNVLIHCQRSDDVFRDMCSIIEASRSAAYHAVNTFLIQRNWLIGQRIAEEELKCKTRAEYGLEIIKSLSTALTNKYGKGFTKTNLYYFYQFYKAFPEIFHSLSGKSDKLLSWTHYRILLQVKDEEARKWSLSYIAAFAFSIVMSMVLMPSGQVGWAMA
ncbi:MAG: hypothetical protein IK020_04050 [Clostridiales bacterium]|nr:hypothetical protein [Clostridiales bacterium]